MGQILQRIYQLPSPITTNTHLVTFSTLYSDMIKLIICQITSRADKLNIRLVSRKFKDIVQPFIRQYVVHFPNERNTHQSNMEFFHEANNIFSEANNRFMIPYLIPQLLEINLGDSDQYYNSEIPTGCLKLNSCKEFPPWINTLQVRSVICSLPSPTSQNISGDPREILIFLNSHDLPEMRAFVLENTLIGGKLWKKCSEMPKLVCFTMLSCQMKDSLSFDNVDTFNCLEELYIDTNNFQSLFPSKKLRICTIYISGDNIPRHNNTTRVHTIRLENCELLESFELTCRPSYTGFRVFVTPPKKSTSFKSCILNGTRVQCGIAYPDDDWKTSLKVYILNGIVKQCKISYLDEDWKTNLKKYCLRQVSELFPTFLKDGDVRN